MNTDVIVSGIDEEIARLQEARRLLTGTVVIAPATRSPRKASHGISAEGRARIAAAQKARWAKQKKNAKTKAAA